MGIVDQLMLTLESGFVKGQVITIIATIYR